MHRDPFGAMDVLADAASSTLQEFGKSVVDASVSQDKAVIDPDGSLKPTTVDGDATLRFLHAAPSAKASSGAHGQVYCVLHRDVQCVINFVGEPDEYTSDQADFDAIMHSWKWST